jgi:nucleotide-binding universal stress UspA family protein
MYDMIVFPTDGERSSERACEDAVELADLHDATLHVVHVVDEATVELLSEVGETGTETVEGSPETDAEEMVEEAS